MRVIPMMKTMEKTPRTTSQMMKVIPTETAMGTEMEMEMEMEIMDMAIMMMV